MSGSLLAGLPLIADPWFYVVAVPALLLIGLSKSGFASGFGSLAVPMMGLVIPVPQAAAIMLPLLMVMDAAALHQLWRHADRALLRFLLPWGLLGSLLGFALFGLLSSKAVAGFTGALTLAFLAHRLLWRRMAGPRPTPRWVGAVCATASGVTSFVAHAGGPPVSAYLLPLRLSPLAFSGFGAVFFAVLNLSKWGPYASLGLIDGQNMATAALLVPLAPLGVWAGAWMTHRVSAAAFYRLAYAGMFCTGVKLLWDGLR